MRSVSFDLNTRDILTSTRSGDIYIRGNLFTETEDAEADKGCEDCVLIITRSQWDGLQKDFFARKTSYNENWNGDWCGTESVFGEAVPSGDAKLTVYGDPDRTVPMLRAETVQLEMEHG